MASSREQARTEGIRLGMYHGPGADPDPIVQRLQQWGIAAERLTREELTATSLERFDVVFLPGGWYPLDKQPSDAIRQHVLAGGGTVGTCAGAYLVAGGIPIIPGRILRSNLRGRLYLEPQRGDHPILAGAVRECRRHKDRQWEPIAVTHLGGPMMYPENREHIVASYDVDGEIGAILAAEVGLGRAVALASHPELPLADLPAGDPADPDVSHRQGDVSLILRNSVLWAAGLDVPAAAD